MLNLFSDASTVRHSATFYADTGDPKSGFYSFKPILIYIIILKEKLRHNEEEQEDAVLFVEL